MAFNIPPTDPSLDDPNTLNKYDEIDFLGQGGFGEVTRIRHKDTGYFYALKKVSLVEAFLMKLFHCLARERRAARELRDCPFILQIYSTFVHDQNLYMLMEFVERGDCYRHLCYTQGFSTEVCRFYTAELILALEYLRSKHWVHRDMKTENLLLDINWQLKLADFGVAKKIGDPSGDRGKDSTAVGALIARAPEVIDQAPTTCNTDLWGLGVIVYSFATMLPLYPNYMTVDGLTADIKTANYNPLPAVIDAGLIDLHSKLMVVNHADRLGASNFNDLKAHPFISGLMNLDLYRMIPPPIYEYYPEFHPVAHVARPGSPPEFTSRSPSGRSPPGLSHSGRSPLGLSHSGRSPLGLSDSGISESPSGRSPSGRSPSGRTPSGRSPSSRSPLRRPPSGRSPSSKPSSGSLESSEPELVRNLENDMQNLDLSDHGY